jgi:tetratricopeptide (TPR) repeat protein
MGMHLDPGPQWFTQAEHAIARTLELDPVQCDALGARGQVLWSPSRGFQHVPALRAVNAALKISPSRYNIRTFRAAILFHNGFYEQAERDAVESILVNPAYALALATRGMIAQYKGDYAAARDWFDQSIALDPTLVHPNIFGPTIPILLGRPEEAREKIRKSRQVIPEESHLTSTEGLIASHEGNFKLAERLADDACSANTKTLTHTHHTWHCAAGVYAMCGKPEKAMLQLQRCAKMGLPNYRLFTTDPFLKTLQGDPEFTALMSDLRRQFDQYRAVVELVTNVN